MVMSFTVLFSILGLGVALLGIQIRLSAVTNERIHSASARLGGEIKELRDRIERGEVRFRSNNDKFRDELCGQTNERIRNISIRLGGEIKELRDRIERGEVRLRGRTDQFRDEIKPVATELNARIDRVKDELKEIRAELAFIKGHLSSTMDSGSAPKG